MSEVDEIRGQKNVTIMVKENQVENNRIFSQIILL
jgi:hypothetical protein